MKPSRNVKKKSLPTARRDAGRVALLLANRNLRQKNIVVGLLVLVLVVLFFFITYTRLKMGTAMLNQ